MFQRCFKKKYDPFGLSLWSLTPLSAIFQLYRSGCELATLVVIYTDR